jgi:hypothetical protein
MRTRKGAPLHCLGRVGNSEAKPPWNLETNRQEKMTRAYVIPAQRSRPIMPNKILQGRLKLGGGPLLSRPLPRKCVN